jgi:hypothetical protein
MSEDNHSDNLPTKETESCLARVYIKYPEKYPENFKTICPAKPDQPAMLVNKISSYDDIIEMAIMESAGGYKNGDCKFRALQAFYLFHEAGYVPPYEIMEMLSLGIKHWCKEQRRNPTLTLERAIGVKVSHQGDAGKAFQESFYFNITREIWQLTHVFNITAKAACYMVAGRIKEDYDWDKIKMPKRCPSGGTLEDHYSKRGWSAFWKERENREVIDSFRTETDNQKKERLAHYPAAVFKLKSVDRMFEKLDPYR